MPFLTSETVKIFPNLSADKQNIFKTFGGYQGYATTFSFQQGISCDGCPMNDQRRSGCCQIFLDATENGLRWVIRGGWNFSHFQNTFGLDHEIRESAPCVHADPDFLRLHYLQLSHEVAEQVVQLSADALSLLLLPPIPKEEISFSRFLFPQLLHETLFSLPIATRASIRVPHCLHKNS